MKSLLPLFLSYGAAFAQSINFSNIAIQATADTNLTVLGMTNEAAPTRRIPGAVLVRALVSPGTVALATNVAAGLSITNPTLSGVVVSGGFTNNGTAVFTNGNAGFGTNNPQGALQVRSGNDTNQNILLLNNSAGTLRFNVDTNGAGTFSSSATAGAFFTTGTGYVTSSGRGRIYFPDATSVEVWNSTKAAIGDLKLGILYVSNAVVFPPIATGPANITNGLSAHWNNGGNQTFTVSPTGGTTSSDAMVISSNGNVGIGTNIPVANLHIFSTNGPYAIQISGVRNTNVFSVNTNGDLAALGTIAAGSTLSSSGSIVAGAANKLGHNGRAGFYSPDTSSEEVWNSAKNAAGDLKLGTLYPSNAIVMPPIATAPTSVTNGLIAQWNSNGYLYRIMSPVGATTNKIELIEAP